MGALDKHGDVKMSNIPPLTVKMLYSLGLAFEAGTDDTEQRQTWGNEVCDWLREAEKSPEWKAFIDEHNKDTAMHMFNTSPFGSDELVEKDEVPLQCACTLIASVRNGKIVEVTIQVGEIEVSEDLVYFEPKPKEENIALVRQAIQARALPEVQLAK